ncbi:hypothetical protein GOV14_03065 [Candidatus Pacearchaeota archaeon]|nr:hypothetical protein [Candidatus Pacearchaeota archaeon]
MKTLQEKPQLEETVTIADFEKTFNSSSKTQRKSLANEILIDTYELLDFKDTGYKPTHADYDSFVTDFSAYIRQKVEPEAYRHDAQLALAHVRAVQLPTSRKFKTLERLADNVETKEQYQAVVKTAADLGDKGIKRVYNNLQGLRKRLRKGDESAIEEAQIPSAMIQNLIHDPYRDLKSYKEVARLRDGLKDKKNPNLKEILTALGDATMKNIATGLGNPHSELMQSFLRRYGICSDDIKDIKKGRFDYHKRLKRAKRSLNLYKEIFQNPKKLDTGIKDFVNAVALNTIRKKDPEQKFETGNMVLDYSFRTRTLDAILQELTRDACINKCEQSEPRCCTRDYFKTGVPSQILAVQSFEAIKNKAHLKISSNSNGDCNYHNFDGCKLTLFKSPICLGHICSVPRKDLPGSDEGGRPRSAHTKLCRSFINSMCEIRSSTLNVPPDWYMKSRSSNPLSPFPEVLNRLDDAIKYGSELVKLKHGEKLGKQTKKKTKKSKNKKK